MISSTETFCEALPVWLAEREAEMNLTAGFRAVFEVPAGSQTVLRLAASTRYRVWLNGTFLACGPTRGPHGFYRVDEWDLTPHLYGGLSLIAIEVAGYNVNSYAYLDQPSFLQAEVISDRQVRAATAVASESVFHAEALPERIQRVPRYSFQRAFCEIYRLTPGINDWRTDPTLPFGSAKLTIQPAKCLRSASVPLPNFLMVTPDTCLASGILRRVPIPQHPWRDRALTDISAKLKGYREQELETNPSLELQQWSSIPVVADGQPVILNEVQTLAAQTWRIFGLDKNRTGFIGMRVICTEPATLYLTFDEVLTEGDVDWMRLACINIATYSLAPGAYDLETFEPYTLRYLKLLALDGAVSIQNIFLRELACPDADRAVFACSDPQVNQIFEAARETYRQNAIDIFMDCPSRERAGWLCDSFFTARAAADVSGHTQVENVFLENFFLPEGFPFLPEGMLPMCYPADHNDGVFIPNWALWFVVQLEDYQARGGSEALIRALEPRVLALFNYFLPFENSDGLLERLDQWVFVEWSLANDFVQDVSYPSNMLYCGALDAASRLYKDPALSEKAGRIRQRILEQSFNGEFFADNAVRKNGTLHVTRNMSETCQYYAFFFGSAAPETHPQLWQRLRDDFGPHRAETGKYADVHPAAPFIGYYLRLELLSRYGESDQILREVSGYFGHMAVQTGTLWEHGRAEASCCHGFASYAVHLLLRDVLGIKIDRRTAQVLLKAPAVALDWCRGSIPVGEEYVTFAWEQGAGGIHQDWNIPGSLTLRQDASPEKIANDSA